MHFDISTLIYSTITVFLISLVIAIAVTIFQNKFSNNSDPDADAIDQINKLLPQTQCAQCDYPGCIPYATAIIKDAAPINKCIPGGQDTIKEIAELLNKDEIPLDSENKQVYEKPMVVKIQEDSCIGCTKCIAACPVDAIIGAPKQMHAVITDYCTGCMLCIPPCPMDCIEIIEKPNKAV